jgi:hypothetical protein
MRAIDLNLQDATEPGQLDAFLISPSGSDAFRITIPPQLAALHQAWLRRFIAHHDPAAALVPADVVANYAVRLTSAMLDWLAQPHWQPLRRTLDQLPGLPLRLRCSTTNPLIERLPWEALPLERPIWRLAPLGPATATARSPRRPRMLLLVGAEDDLNLQDEIDRLSRLHREGRIALTTLRGQRSCLGDLRAALTDRRGWEALLFLGHSSSDPQAGGRLQLGDGTWLSGHDLRRELEPAASNGLALVLLNSCCGMDLARTSLAAGVPWSLCFREPVPDRAASIAFSTLFQAMQDGLPLSQALQRVRQQLQSDGPAGCDLLLSAMAAGAQADLQLPLSRPRQVRLRLASSQPRQAIASAVLIAGAFMAELMPANPLSSYLLDRRLDLQRHWRLISHQSGPKRPPLPVLLLDPHRSFQELGVTATPGSTPRAALAEVLRRTPPHQVPLVGLDVVLDRPAAGSDQLAAVIRSQQPRRVIAGWLGPDARARDAGRRSQPIPQLLQAGLEAKDLSLGFIDNHEPSKPLPLHVAFAITEANFAAALADVSTPYLPPEAVIDWSIDWQPLIRIVSIADLPRLQAKALLVGTDGTIDSDQSDLFPAPAAIRALLPEWGGASDTMPGAMVQAVMAQSLALRHWFRLFPLTAAVALAAGLGVLLAAALPQRRWQVLALGGVGLIVVPISLQIAISQRLLIPLVFPLAALSSSCLLRRD